MQALAKASLGMKAGKAWVNGGGGGGASRAQGVAEGVKGRKFAFAESTDSVFPYGHVALTHVNRMCAAVSCKSDQPSCEQSRRAVGGYTKRMRDLSATDVQKVGLTWGV